MNIEVHVVNAFVDEGRGGNPAGVVLGADGLSSEQKQAIAREVGLSETAFVSSSQTADFKLDFFTPSRQIAHCGHATIATFSHLRQAGLLAKDWTSKETIDGCRAIRMKSATAYMEQSAPLYEVPERADRLILRGEIARSLNLGPDGFAADPIICSTGGRFLLLPLSSPGTLRDLKPDQAAIQDISERLDLIGFYAFAPMADGYAATTRMFAPRFGITEESATGMAAGPLVCYLKERQGLEGTSVFIQQGLAMPHPSPSRIHVELEMDGTRIQRLFVGGDGKAQLTLAIEL